MAVSEPSLLRNCEEADSELRLWMGHSWLYRHVAGLAIAACAGLWVVAAALIYFAA
jgi:hypothetical protein